MSNAACNAPGNAVGTGAGMPGAMHATERNATNATTTHQPAKTRLSLRTRGAVGFGSFAALQAVAGPGVPLPDPKDGNE